MGYRFVILFTFASLAACAAEEQGKAPSFSVSDTWKSLFGHEKSDSIKVEDTKADSEWWKQFGDETLNQLITKAVTANYDLKAAESRVKEARALRNAAHSLLFPQVNAIASIGRVKESKDVGLTNVYEAGF